MNNHLQYKHSDIHKSGEPGNERKEVGVCSAWCWCWTNAAVFGWVHGEEKNLDNYSYSIHIQSNNCFSYSYLAEQ